MMHRPDDPAAPAAHIRQLRPKPPLSGPAEIPDSKVGQLLTLIDRSGIPQELEELIKGRPGPKGMRPRVVLAGLLLAVYYNNRATIADAWRILHYSLRPRARGWLGIPDCPHVIPGRVSPPASASTGAWTRSPLPWTRPATTAVPVCPCAWPISTPRSGTAQRASRPPPGCRS